MRFQNVSRHILTAALVAALLSVAAGFTSIAFPQFAEAQGNGGTPVRLFGFNPDISDASPISTDSYGAVYSRADHPNRFSCTVTVSTATTLTAFGGSCAAPGAGKSFYITDVKFDASASGILADAFPTIKSGTGGTCGTATTVVWQTLSAAAVTAVDNRTTPIKVTANHELCWITSTAGSKAITVAGFIAP